MTYLSPRECGAILSALGFALAGELEPAWGRNAGQLMNEAYGKVRAGGNACWLAITPGEARAALEAISQMTAGNARDFNEWRLCTHGTYAQWQALLRIEAKLQEIV